MSWLPASVRVISVFASAHGTASGLIVSVVCLVTCVAVAFAASLRKFFESLPKIVESIYKRRADTLQAKKDVKAAEAEGKVNQIKALTDRKAMRRKLKDRSRVVRAGAKQIKDVDEAVKLYEATLQLDFRAEDTGNGADTPPDRGSPDNVRQLREPGTPQS